MEWKNLNFFKHRSNSSIKSLIDSEYVEKTLADSPVPVITVIILIWVVSSVLLLLSENNQRDLTVWQDGQKAPFPVWARTDFSYVDSLETEALKNHARNAAPKIYRVSSRASETLKNQVFRLPEQFSGAEAGTAEKILSDKFKTEPLYRSFSEELVFCLKTGIADKAQLAGLTAGSKVQVFSSDGEISYDRIPADAAECAGILAGKLEISPDSAEYRVLTEKLTEILSRGNLKFDADATANMAEIAAADIPPVIKERRRGDLLVERNQRISRETVDMLTAEKNSLPHSYGMALLSNQIIQSFILLVIALFFLYRIYPGIFKSNRRFSIGGFAFILGLLANYGAIQLFSYFFRRGIIPDYELLFFMMPITFGASLMAILLGSRPALFAGFLVSSLTALMVLPDRSFELALRWFAISAVMTLFVRNVTDYRSFFVRVFFGSILLGLLVNSDVILSIYGESGLLKLMGLLIVATAFICATVALLSVFAFELFFNADTPMSLMVLSDYNHPLLEKLKREAPGTMFHSMTVATLAEDAARAIGANAARAKAGALFHDIGKLAMPQCFVENNVDSSKEYMKLPPQRSCGIIRGHVKEGLNFAREYRLCSFVREAVATHHGDDLISFFYQLAKQNSNGENPDVLESQFRYDGEPPRGKELTIISLADACEAASRSLNKPSPTKLESLVNSIFIGRLQGGQLRNSELSVRELNIVRECFIADLISFNHGRIAYQKEKSDDSTALPLAEQAAAGSEKK